MRSEFSAKRAQIAAGMLAAFFLAFCCLASDVSITVLHTADLHGTMIGGSGGGLLQCAALVREVRSREKNVLLVDCGDLIQGTAVGFLSRGSIVIEAAMAMGYDALVPGNHEFDWGLENLVRLYDMAGIPVVVCNMLSSDGSGAVFKNARPFIVREMEGVRVAVVGLITPHIASWSRPRLIGDAVFERSVQALRRIMPLVRADDPDIIILAAHQGHVKWRGDNQANEINAVARAFPDIDVIIGAHTHREVVMRDVHGVPYTQAGCYGTSLGKISLTVDRESRTLKDMRFELLRVDDSVTPDPALLERFGTELERAEKYLNVIVGSVARRHASKSDFPGQSGTQLLIARAIAEAVEADAAIHRALTGYELRSGAVAMRDLFGVLPYENYIGVASLTAADIVEILEENSLYLDTREFRGVYGLEYEIHLGMPEGSRVRNLRLTDGRPLREADRVRVAFNSYDMASAGGRLSRLREIVDRPASKLDETRIDTRDALADYLGRHGPVDEMVVPGAIVVRP